MVVSEADVKDIMGGMQETGGVRINNKHKLRHRFDIVKKLGQGTYGKVQLAINKETGQDVAIKTIRKARIETEKDLIRIRREIQIMSSVTHPHIIHIYEVFENRDKMVLVMEYAAGGELYDHLSEKKVLTEEEARRIFRQVASACYYCHKHKICHRDLKLENILLDEYGNAKLADFGLSNVFDEDRRLTTYCGSPLYASPEIVCGTPYAGPEVDCWSLGVLLYTLVYGAMPFDGSNFKKLVKQIMSGEFYEPPKVSPASELIHALLSPVADQRATLADVCAHWWLNQGESLNCLEVAEELANQTPVRLDVLLSLAPREPDKEHVMALTDHQVVAPEPGGSGNQQVCGSDSLSLNSAMELEPAASPGPPPSSPQPTEAAASQGPAEKPPKRALDDAEEGARKAENIKPEKTSKKKKKPQAPPEPTVPAVAAREVPMSGIVEEAGEGVAGAPEVESAPPEGAASEVPHAEPSDVTPPPQPAVKAERVVAEPSASVASQPPEPAVNEVPVADVARAVATEPEADAREESVAQVEEAGSSDAKEVQPEGSDAVPASAPVIDEVKTSPSDAIAVAAEKGSSLIDPAIPDDQKQADISSQPAPSMPQKGSSGPTPDVTPQEKPKRKSHVKYPPKDVPEPAVPAVEQVNEPSKGKEISGEVPAIPAVEAPVRTADSVPPQAESKESEQLPKDDNSVVKEVKPKPKVGVSPRPSPPKHDCLGLSKQKQEQPPVDISQHTVSKPIILHKRVSGSPEPDVAKPEAAGADDVRPAAPAEPSEPAPEPESSRVSPLRTADEPSDQTSEPPSKPAQKARGKSPKIDPKPKERVVTPKPSLHIDDARRRPAARQPSQSVSSILGPAPADTRAHSQPAAIDSLSASQPVLSPASSEGERRTPVREKRPGSELPRRAPSKEYIIPIQLADDEPGDVEKQEVKPGVSPASSAEKVSRPSSGDRVVSRASSGEKVSAARPAVSKSVSEARRPSRPVSTTSSLQSLPERISSSGEEEEATSAGESARPAQTSLTRSSRREFIIPIALEGGGVMTPSAELVNSEPERSQSGLFRTHQLAGQRRLGSLLSDRAGSGSGERPWSTTLWGPLQRVSSMKGVEDRPPSGVATSWSTNTRRLSRPMLSGSGSGERPLLSGSGERPLLSGSGERPDSHSSGGEEDDEDDQFELFTADSLFGSLLDRVRNMSRRRLGDDAASKRSFLLSEPLRLSSSTLGGSRLGSGGLGGQRLGSSLGGQRLPSLFGPRGEVRSLFDQPLPFKHGSLFDQPPFARHSSLGSQSVGESSDSGSQQEDNADEEQARAKSRVRTSRRTTPQGSQRQRQRERELFGPNSLWDRRF